MKKVGFFILLALWLGLSLWLFLGPKEQVSIAERRPLAQAPTLSGNALLSGSFMEDFESFAQDQFPLRQTFRQGKALFHRYVLGCRDSRKIYRDRQHLAEMQFPLQTQSVTHALASFQKIYDTYLNESGCKVYSVIIPDKGQYLSYPKVNFSQLTDLIEAGMPWAEHIPIGDLLNRDSYYHTDTHWRQEKLLPVAKRIAQAMNARAEMQGKTETLSDTFYGVYYGQAALPAQPDKLQVITSPTIDASRVYLYEKDAYEKIYDVNRLSGNDMYEVFLSGPQSLLRIENPNAEGNRELIIFRDSFGSSLAPLLLPSYSSVTLIDIRYIPIQRLGQYVNFEKQDVLFLHSALVLNKNLI